MYIYRLVEKLLLLQRQKLLLPLLLKQLVLRPKGALLLKLLVLKLRGVQLLKLLELRPRGVLLLKLRGVLLLLLLKLLVLRPRGVLLLKLLLLQLPLLLPVQTVLTSLGMEVKNWQIVHH